MAIRLRTVNGTVIALCAAETDAMPGDKYLDDNEHYALAAKFARDWRGQSVTMVYADHDALAETQKLRDAKEELRKWDEAGRPPAVAITKELSRLEALKAAGCRLDPPGGFSVEQAIAAGYPVRIIFPPGMSLAECEKLNRRIDEAATQPIPADADDLMTAHWRTQRDTFAEQVERDYGQGG